MFHKASILAAAVAIVLAVAPSADAKQGKSGHSGKSAHVSKSVHVKKSVHVNKSVHVKKTVHVKKNVHVHYVVGRSYNGHIWYGRHGHRWHGAWYAYGVGPCWVLVDGLWFWNVVACPL